MMAIGFGLEELPINYIIDKPLSCASQPVSRGNAAAANIVEGGED